MIAVHTNLDLVETALKFTEDDQATIEGWLTTKQIKHADDVLARNWNQNGTIFWGIVVAPWVLVQEQAQKTESNQIDS